MTAGSALGSRARRIVGVVATLVVTALAVGAAQGWGHTDQTAVAPPPPPASSAPVVINSTDEAFIQLLIPMDEGALTLFDYLDTRPAVLDPSLRAVVDPIRTAHQTEVREMRAVLAAANVPEQNIHEGHQMPGMVTEVGLAELRAAPGVEARARAVTLIRAHLEQILVLCRGEQDAGASPELKAIAARMQQARTVELRALADQLGDRHD
ncbi:DUF305 domain-containing protein [Micromonospora sp. CPCC 205539]|uniref:DUF305 domain-containing protein n=1 Tax=Micromonospora sp. CPCC 205539 TaxID=3122408 RepID=UPI002FF4192A